MTEYDAVVFDNDGVIVEPSDQSVLVDAVVDAFAAFDVPVDASTVRQSVAEDAVPRDLIADHGLDAEAFWHQRELTASLAQQAHTRAGGKPVYDDVRALDALDVPLGLVSNNQHATVEFLLAHHDIDRFDTAYGRQPTLAGAARRKPDPAYIEQALSDLDASEALYVGDSEKDVVAAHRAGIDSVFLRRDHVSDVSLDVEPTAEVADLRALVERLPELH
ncbi:hydrolase [Haloarcula taiwanensis]|uniref:Hydrolase n=1 Tax=Haloarcula taiwanensis TaxID=1932004 RepID=A0A2H5A3Q5_9EURY|nr:MULTISPECIES: HAD-IA family hydrolase [Haloarcula]AUG49325.1 hydrolase [Haloarcula taiwanensis]RLM34693.1 HAD family hydrolase [Haloarcula sp. Atlit-120R]RLM44107.1 HAD family hydrolase [Haloarcula sp. Atlit-47R]